jgi:hypothetical protein
MIEEEEIAVLTGLEVVSDHNGLQMIKHKSKHFRSPNITLHCVLQMFQALASPAPSSLRIFGLGSRGSKTSSLILGIIRLTIWSLAKGYSTS